jgi:large exoprotein involved in heme utilization and adhesion
LSVQDGAQVVVSTAGSGNAGDLIVKAREIILSGTSLQSRSGLFASAVVDTGNGGDINVAAQRLTIQNGATVSVSNFGSTAATAPGRGAAGNILINANAIDLKNGTVSASTLAGASGNIEIQSSALVMQRNAMISTNSKGNEPGGNIRISSELLVGVGNSDITANAVNARGGQVNITADSILGLIVRDRLTSNNDITATSDLGILFNGKVEINSANLNPTNVAVGLSDQLSGQQITQQCSAIRGSRFIVTGRGGIPHNPIFKSFRDHRAWQDVRDLSGPRPIAQAVIPNGAIVEMTSLQRNPDGSLELTHPNPIALAAAETCSK